MAPRAPARRRRRAREHSSGISRLGFAVYRNRERTLHPRRGFTHILPCPVEQYCSCHLARFTHQPSFTSLQAKRSVHEQTIVEVWTVHRRVCLSFQRRHLDGLRTGSGAFSGGSGSSRYTPIELEDVTLGNVEDVTVCRLVEDRSCQWIDGRQVV